MTPTPEDLRLWLEEVEGLLDGATPGPWYTERGGVFNATRGYMVVPTGDSPQDERDANLIASAPTLALRVKVLVGEVERLREAMAVWAAAGEDDEPYAHVVAESLSRALSPSTDEREG